MILLFYYAVYCINIKGQCHALFYPRFFMILIYMWNPSSNEKLFFKYDIHFREILQKQKSLQCQWHRLCEVNICSSLLNLNSNFIGPRFQRFMVFEIFHSDLYFFYCLFPECQWLKASDSKVSLTPMSWQPWVRVCIRIVSLYHGCCTYTVIKNQIKLDLIEHYCTTDDKSVYL